MKLLSSLLAVLAVSTTAFAADAPAAKTPPPAPAPATAPAPAPTIVDEYVTVLSTELTLTDPEKKEVQDVYNADEDALKKVLSDSSLSAFQKAQQVADLRATRNGKIISILGHDLDRQHKFAEVETTYRVALVEYAAGDTPPPQAPPAPVAPATPPPAAKAPAAPAPAPAPAK